MLSIRDVAFIKIPDSFATASVRLTDANAVRLSKSGAQGTVISSSWAIPNASHTGLFITLYQKNQGDLIPIANCNLVAATVSLDAAAPITSVISKLTHPEGIYIAPDQEIWAALSKSADVSVSCALGFYGAAPLPEINISVASTLPIPQSLVVVQRGLFIESALPAPQSELLSQLLISGQIISEMSSPQSVASGQVRITGQILSGLPVPQSQLTQEVRANIDSALPAPQSLVAANLTLMSVTSILPVPQSSVTGSLRLASVISALPVPQSSATASLRLGSVVSALPVPQSVIAIQPPYKERTVTISSTTAYTDYPLLVNFNASNALSSGADIRVFDSANNPLTFYREPYSTSTSTTIIVRVLTIVNGTTTIKIRYGQGETVSVSTASAIASILTTSSCQLWLMGDDITGNLNDPISAWVDRSPNNVSVTQSQTVRRPLKVNASTFNRFAAFFDGADDRLEAVSQGTTDFTVFTVSRPTNLNPGAEPGLYAYGWNGSSAFGVGIQGNVNWQVALWGFRWLTSPGSAANTTDWRLKTVRRSGTTISLKLSDTEVATGSATGTETTTLGNTFYLGFAPGNNYFAGNHYAYIAVDSTLTTTQETNIRRYLSQKAQIGSYPSVTVGNEV